MTIPTDADKNELSPDPRSHPASMDETLAFERDILAFNEALLIGGLHQHELREAAERSNARLQLEIAGRTRAGVALHQAIVDLQDAARGVTEQASRTKDNFLAALSHELRTPLTPVLMTVAGLCEDARLPADAREQLGMVGRNVALEARLIDDLLDLTKISHGKLQISVQPCDAHDVIGLAVEMVREEAGAKNLVLESVLEASHAGLNADPVRLQQVIWNLLRNAVKFTPRGGRISLRTTNDVTASGEKWLRIEVADSGIGIAASRLEQIFQPFDQGGLVGDHRFGGAGLGLAIARPVIELHGGQISAQSAGLNRGATFVVTLPGAMNALAESVPTKPASPAKSPEFTESQQGDPVTPLRLLVVEDHVSTLQTLRRLLRGDGHHVVTASTVGDALAAAAAGKFDLVISDLGLPDGTGTRLMGELRDSYGLRGIALSGYGTDEDLLRSRAAGFFAHLVKPASLAELRRVIATRTVAA